MLIYIQMTIALIMGALTSITDFKDKKIYNKNVLFFSFISFIFYIVLYKEIEIIYITPFIINLIISIIISFSFFYFKIWSAGDAKLFIAIIFMIPYELYELSENNYFGALYILIITFSIAFVYVFFETLFLFIIDKNKKEKLTLHKWNKNQIIYNLILYITGYLFLMLSNNSIKKIFYNFYINNNELLFIINVLILLYIYRILKHDLKMTTLTLVICFISNIIFFIINGTEHIYVDYKMIIITFVILLYRNLAEKYNYKKIKIVDLKERMILSFESVLSFYSSKVKGLPKYTDESTDYRLNKDEVESIKRWSKTPKGNDEIIIVRHMPFAPFLFIGEIIFFIIKVFI